MVMAAGRTIPDALAFSISDFFSAAGEVRREQQKTLNLQLGQLDGQYADAQAKVQQGLDLINQQIGDIDPAYRDAEGLIDEQRAFNDLQREQAKGEKADQAKIYKAQQALLTAQNSQYKLARQQLQARQQEFTQLSAALDDTQNQIDVGRGLQQRAVGDKRLQAAGLQAIDINKPLTGQAPENLAPGLRYAIETDAQQLGRQFERTGQQREFAAEGAGLNVTGANLGLAGVNLGVSKNRSARDFALTNAGLNLSDAKLGAQSASNARDVALQRTKLDGQAAGYSFDLAAAQREYNLKKQQGAESQAGLNLNLQRPSYGYSL